MKVNISRSAILSFFLAFFTVLQSVMLGGCATHQLAVVPCRSRNVVVLSAEEVVAVMRRAWFPDEQIERLGLELRDALASHGAARIRSADRTQALFLTDGHFIYVTVRGRGGFFYSVRKGPSHGPG